MDPIRMEIAWTFIFLEIGMFIANVIINFFSESDYRRNYKVLTPKDNGFGLEMLSTIIDTKGRLGIHIIAPYLWNSRPEC